MNDTLYGSVVRTYLLGIGVKTLLIVPLNISRQLVGTLTFRFTEDREFRPEEIEIARRWPARPASRFS
jgi:GAF domain-containing protein